MSNILYSFVCNVQPIGRMGLVCNSEPEKQKWVQAMWGALEQVAQQRVFQVDLIELMSRQQAARMMGSGDSAQVEKPFRNRLLFAAASLHDKQIH